MPVKAPANPAGIRISTIDDVRRQNDDIARLATQIDNSLGVGDGDGFLTRDEMERARAVLPPAFAATFQKLDDYVGKRLPASSFAPTKALPAKDDPLRVLVEALTVRIGNAGGPQSVLKTMGGAAVLLDGRKVVSVPLRPGSDARPLDSAVARPLYDFEEPPRPENGYDKAGRSIPFGGKLALMDADRVVQITPHHESGFAMEKTDGSWSFVTTPSGIHAGLHTKVILHHLADDPAQTSVEMLPDLVHLRDEPSVVWADPSGRIVVAGGHTLGDYNTPMLERNIEVYDSEKREWRVLPAPFEMDWYPTGARAPHGAKNDQGAVDNRHWTMADRRFLVCTESVDKIQIVDVDTGKGEIIKARLPTVRGPVASRSRPTIQGIHAVGRQVFFRIDDVVMRYDLDKREWTQMSRTAEPRLGRGTLPIGGDDRRLFVGEDEWVGENAASGAAAVPPMPTAPTAAGD